MLDIGRKYFNLSSDKNTSLVVSDAWEYLEKLKRVNYFSGCDDLFIGCDTAYDLRTNDFLQVFIHIYQMEESIFQTARI